MNWKQRQTYVNFLVKQESTKKVETEKKGKGQKGNFYDRKFRAKRISSI